MKKFGIFSSRSMKINAYTPVGGYTPGQTINLHIKVNNETNESILKFSAKLVKVSAQYYFFFSFVAVQMLLLVEE